MLFLKEIFIYISVGIIPVFIFAFLKTKNIDKALSWSAACSGIPFLFIQIITTSTGFNPGIIWVVPFLISSLYLAYFIKTQDIYARQDWKDFSRRITAGTIVGILWWITGFLPNIYRMRVYPDILWNIGNAAQFMHTLQIQDPHWFQESSLNYHFYSHRVIAGIGIVTGSDLINLVIISFSLITTISIAILATAKEFRKTVFYGILAVVLVFLLRPTERWGANRSFMMHMTGYASSTFFWTLPLAIGGILWWFKWDKIRYDYIFYNSRDLKRLINAALGTLIIVITITYSKASGALVFIGMEFVSFLYITFLLFKRGLFLKRLITLAWFGISLAALLLADLLFFHNIFFKTGGDYNKLSLGLDAKDYTNLKGGLATAIFASVGLPLIFIILNRRPSKKQIILFSAALFNIIFFTLLTHRTYSDFFFMFNSVILGIFSVTTGLGQKQIKRFCLSIIVLSISCILFSWIGLSIKGFGSYFKFAFRPAAVELKSPESTDFFKLKHLIKTNDLIVYPYEPDETYKLSAIFQARFWNESARFTDYIIQDANQTFNGKPETIDDRIKFTKNWVFNNEYVVPDQYKSIADSFGYIIVLTSDLPRLAEKFKNSEIVTSEKWSLITVRINK